MIISHKHKYIFWKPIKVAGTSVQCNLQKYCGERDVVTPIKPTPEEEGYDISYIPRNYKGYQTHMLPMKIREIVGEEIWDSYFKFTIVRNPWERLVSHFCMDVFRNQTKDDSGSFKKFLNNHNYLGNTKRYFHNDQALADFHIRYENLEDEYKKVCEIIRIPYEKLPILKSNMRDRTKHYSEYYNEKMQDVVGENLKKEIDFFDCEFVAV